MNFAPPVGKQLDSINAAFARLNIWEGSVRSSKTICSIVAWIRYVMMAPPGNLFMVGKSERTLKRNVLDVIAIMLPQNAYRYVGGAGECYIYGRKIYIGGANDERAGDRIRGMTLLATYVDEISVLPESFFTMLLTRLSLDGATLFGTTNPDSPRHWLKTKYLDKAGVWIKHDGTVETNPDGMDLARFSFNLADNPNLSKAYVAALRKEITGLWAKRLIDGQWVLAEGAIYDTFDSESDGPHVVVDLPEMDAFWLGIDYGTTNPFCCLLFGLSVPDEKGVQRIYVCREWRWDSKKKQRQLTDSEYAKEMRQWLVDLGKERLLPGNHGESLEPAIERIYVDPSAASFAIQLHRSGWFGVKHADNAVDDGIRAVSTLLNGDWLKIHESCTGLIAEMGDYVWDDKAQERGEDKPMKVDDHGPDALRYGVFSRRRMWLGWVAAYNDEMAA